MNTEFVPFNPETMDQAISFKTTKGAVVTQVTHFINTAAMYPVSGVSEDKILMFTSDGHEYVHTKLRNNLLMEVEVKIEFPCLCYVCDFILEPDHIDHRAIVLLVGGNPKGYISNTDALWKYATPLTQDQALEYLNN